MALAPLPPPPGGQAESRSRPATLIVLIVALGVLVVALLTAALFVAQSRPPAAAHLRFGTVPGTDPGIGDTASGGQGTPVDGIGCGPIEQTFSHEHAHLYILDEGVVQPIAGGIGLPGAPAATRCYYWLHTHDRTGVVHIESPTGRAYTLGELFDIWGQPLSTARIARLSVRGRRLTYFVDGQEHRGNPRDITLTGQTQVVIEIGRTVPPPRFDFSRYYTPGRIA
ncbi:MAG: hypothetical protein ABR598_04655 [Candidatus Dormibacteria bacterium]